jgi:histone acetyltransferase (RNA polymerase elongator complex component)
MKEEQQLALLKPARPYLDQGVIDAIRISTRPDCIDEKACDLFAAQRVTTIELGVQSFDDGVLALSNRGHDSGAAISAAKLLKKRGFILGIQLMPGLPGDHWRSFANTVAKTIDLAPTFVRIYPTVVVSGSDLESLYQAGVYHPLSLSKAVAWCSEASRRFTAAGVRVIRCGLQPTTELENSLVAGPYHPAFGELVRSRLWLGELRRKMALLDRGQKLKVHVSHRDVSALVGINRSNLKRLDALGHDGRLTIIQEKTWPRGRIRYAFDQ